MLSVIAFLIGFASFAVCGILGGGLTLGCFLSFRKTDFGKLNKFLIWVIAAIVCGTVFSLVVFGSISWSEAGGPPTEQDWKNLYLAFAYAGAVPGVALSGGGLTLLITRILLNSRLSIKQ